MSQSGPHSIIDQLAEIAFNELCPKDHFIQNVISAAKAKKADKLKKLSKQRNLLTEDSRKNNAIVTLFLDKNIVAALFLADFLQMSDANKAEWAAQAGKKVLAESYINKVEPTKRDYVRLAAKAACGGWLELAEYFLGDRKSGVHWVIEEAAYAGQKTVVEHFFEKLPVNERDYDFVARCADAGDQPALAKEIRLKQPSFSETSPFKKPQPILRKAPQTPMPPPLYNKPAPMELPFYPHPNSMAPLPLPAWVEKQPPLLYQFRLPNPPPSHYEQSADQALQTRTKPTLF